MGPELILEISTEESNEVLENLVASVLDDCRSYNVRLEWVVDGEAPRGQSMAETVAGVTLPNRIPESMD